MSINLYTSTDTIPDYILKSWKRCEQIGLDVTSFDKEHILGEFELKEYYEQYDEMLYYSIPILNDVYHSIRGTEFLLLLATPDGYIIDTMGEPSFIRHANKVSLKKGANWLEESKGTNAIGTAIVEKKPILVHGIQHYCHDNQFLTCAASPIMSPDGQLLGILNLSTHQHHYHPHTLGLVKSAAHRIEQALLLAYLKKQQETMTSDLDFVYDHNPSALLTIQKGKIIRMNIAATKTFGCLEQSKIDGPLSTFIEGINSSTMTSGKKFSYKNQVFTTHIISDEDNHAPCILLRGDIKKHQDEFMNHYDFTNIIGHDPKLNEMKSLARKIAPLDISILITGETGTGKELFAQSIHGASLRSHQPFIAINCSAIPESLLESELFGYENGAFTGAKRQGQIGKFEAANGGTLFLDEIGDMPLSAQAALLRVLQEGYITRIGGTKPRPIHVRIIAATHKDLQKEIEAGRFRSDLYFRLNGFTLTLPALRNRTDILLLAKHILSRLPFKKEKIELTEDAKAFIKEYEWRGNFRQLKNVLQQAALLAEDKQITKSLLVSLCPSLPKNEEKQENSVTLSLRDHEILLIKQVLKQTNGNITRAAKQLKIGRNTLYRKMKEYNLLK